MMVKAYRHGTTRNSHYLLVASLFFCFFVSLSNEIYSQQHHPFVQDGIDARKITFDSIQNKEYAKAEKALDQYIEKYGDYHGFRTLKSQLFAFQGKMAQAQAILDEAKAIDRSYTSYNYDCGIIYKLDNQYEKAIGYFEKAVSTDADNNFLPRINLAECYLQIKAYDKSLDYYQDALEKLDPIDSCNRNLMNYDIATIYFIKKDYKAALVAISNNTSNKEYYLARDYLLQIKIKLLLNEDKASILDDLEILDKRFSLQTHKRKEAQND
jgi:tetratricopeptide (TPR) repeat protein